MKHIEYVIPSKTIIIAERLEDKSKANEILICPETQKIAKRNFETKAIPDLNLQGISDKYIAFKLIQEKRRK